MLTRIYGTAFLDQKALEEHLERLEQARQRDHRKLGPELDLFMLHPEAPGMPFWLPQGTVLLRLIEDEVRAQLTTRGYVEISTPQVLDEELWHRSGHWDNYRENMYFVEPSEREGGGDRRRFALKPMNCPGACLAYASRRHSYRELPLRVAEFGLVSRYEREGVLHGLLRVRAFTQDDAHIYCTLDQVDRRGGSVCEAIDELYARFGFDDVRVELSTRPDKSIGTDEQWERAEASLCGTRSSARAASTTSIPERAPSTARRSTSTSPTPSAAPGNAAPASSTSRCRSASASPTSAPTTPSTPR